MPKEVNNIDQNDNLECAKRSFSARVRVKLQNKDVNAVIDTGAGRSVIDIGSLEHIGLVDGVQKTKDGLVNASGDEMNVLGMVKIDVKLLNMRNVTHEFMVINTKSFKNILLGRDFMERFNIVTFDFSRHRVKLGTVWVDCIKSLSSPVKVRLVSPTNVPARCEKIVAVRCPKKYSILDLDFEQKVISAGVYVSKARVVPDVNGVFYLSILNVSDSQVSLNGRKVLGYVDKVGKTVGSVPVDYINSVDEWELENNHLKGAKFGSNLSKSEKSALTDLIRKYSNVFARNPKKPKQTSVIHPIVTGDALPVKSRYYRVPVAWEKEINQQVQEMLDNEIIRHSASPWNSPIILVKKKDDSMRFVCDFRGLNNVTKKDTYPLPHIRDVIDKMHRSKYWTTLDAASAYWSMPLKEEDKEKTAFATPRGKYEFNVTSYGLTNAGASYQRLMDVTLSGLSSHRILAYMDDVIIFSRTFREHLSDLELVFQRFDKANISLKASKCVFGHEKVDFLGFELSELGIKPQKRLTTAIEEFKRPECKKEVKSFLGMANFYRTFIQNFAEISHPLNRLTSDNVDFKWDESCQIAFDTLKRKLCSEPVLAFPQIGQQFIIEVDASDVAFGGILIQKGDDGMLHPVAYFSDSVNKSQRNWAPTTKEAFALILAVRHWYVYLAGNHFVLNSDHNPLVYLRDQKDPRGKFGRWIMELEEFDYEINYIPGPKNFKADALSRNRGACDDQPPSKFEENIYSIDDVPFLDQIKEAQSEDDVISAVTRCIAENKPISTGRLKRVQNQLRIENGVLKKSGRPVVPASLRSFVLSEVHDIGHFGVEKTYGLLKGRFYWPSMFQYVKLYVGACETCQKSKCDTSPPKAPLLPMVIPSKPMEFIAMDIAYMPMDNDGYQYILLIGDIFSKYIDAVPLRDQTANAIVRAFEVNWLYFHGNPDYLLSDQGSNVDGETVRTFCDNFRIEKRRSSAYHSQGNGFAERNIRNVKDILRSTLLHRRLNQTKWRKLLPELVFALNTSESKAIQCIPYKVVFGRDAILPIDVKFDIGERRQLMDVVTAKEYSDEHQLPIQDMYNTVIDKLKLSKQVMMRQYNKNLRFNDYQEGDKVWLQVKYYKTGVNRKLAPRRGGPWVVARKLPNGVNFEIRNEKTKETKIVHHDRLSPVRESVEETETVHNKRLPSVRKSVVDHTTSEFDTDSDDETFRRNASHSDYEPSSENDSEEPDDEPRRYPVRERQHRVIPGAIPWSSIP